VLDLMRALQEEMGMAIMMITHDLGVIAEVADEVVVMYAGRVVEHGSLDDIFYRPLHPYTQGLLASIPVLGKRTKDPLKPIPGTVPHPLALPTGCPFRTRCSARMPVCAETPSLKTVQPPVPSLGGVSEGRGGFAYPSREGKVHAVACWLQSNAEFGMRNSE